MALGRRRGIAGMPPEAPLGIEEASAEVGQVIEALGFNKLIG